MRKNFRNKFAALAACVSILGSETSAMNSNKIEVKKTQTIVKAEGRTQPKKINWKNIVKIGGLVVAGGAVVETIHSLIGGFTDSKLGKWSIGEVIKNRLKKNNKLKDDVLKYFPDTNITVPENFKELLSKEDISDLTKAVRADTEKKFYSLKSRFLKSFNEAEKVSNKSVENFPKMEYFQQVLDIIAQHKFTDNENIELNDLLQAIRSDKIKPADKISCGNFGVITMTLNSVKYDVLMLSIGKDGKHLVIRKNGKEIAKFKCEEKMDLSYN